MRLLIIIFIDVLVNMVDVNNIQYQRDLEFGHKEEIRIKKILEEYFGELKILDKYNPFDFENDDYLIELKSRRINHDKYDTAMVNYSKLLRTANSNKIRMIVFNYEDGIYCWQVDSDEYELGRGGRSDRGIEEVYTMCFVKKEYLQNINNYTKIKELNNHHQSEQ